MDVNTLIERILEVSHNENAPDTDLNNKALRWLNSAYMELVEQCRSYLEPYLQRTVSLELIGGAGALPEDVNHVVSVKNKETKQVFSALHAADSRDIFISAQPATRYWVMNGHVYTNTTSDLNVDMIYSARVSELLEGGSENDIVLPSEYHQALVWGSLLWSSMFERGFNTAREISIFQQKWDEAKREIKLSLAAKNASSMRVNNYDLLNS